MYRLIPTQYVLLGMCSFAQVFLRFVGRPQVAVTLANLGNAHGELGDAAQQNSPP